jgi:hypothetical protein
LTPFGDDPVVRDAHHRFIVLHPLRAF